MPAEAGGTGCPRLLSGAVPGRGRDSGMTQPGSLSEDVLGLGGAVVARDAPPAPTSGVFSAGGELAADVLVAVRAHAVGQVGTGLV